MNGIAPIRPADFVGHGDVRFGVGRSAQDRRQHPNVRADCHALNGAVRYLDVSLTGDARSGHDRRWGRSPGEEFTVQGRRRSSG